MQLSARLFGSFLAPGLVLLLVAVQVRFGMNGFDQPHSGLLGVLEIPGILLGWGSIAFLLPLLVWLVLDWWGYHAPALVLKLLGALALGLAVSGMAGIGGGVAAAGQVGAGMASLFAESLGEVVAMIILTALALPGVLLAGAGFRPGRTAPAGEGTPARPARVRKERKRDASADDADGTSVFARVGGVVAGWLKPRKRYTNLADLVRGEDETETPSNGQAWYPDRAYDEGGNELPMQFGRARDVGEIRYADEEDASSDATASAHEPAVAPTGSWADAVEAAMDEVDSGHPVEQTTAEETSAAARESSEAIEPSKAIEPSEAREEESAPLPTVAEVLRGEIDTSILSATGALDASLDDDLDDAEDTEDATGPVHVAGPAPFGAGITLAAPFPTMGAGNDEDDDDEALPPGVRYAEPRTPTRARRNPDHAPAGRPRVSGSPYAEVADARPEATGRVTPTRPRPDASQDPVAAALRSDARREAETVEQAVTEVGRLMQGPRAGNDVERNSGLTAPSIRESVLKAFQGEQSENASQRYLEKLEASGIFDFSDGDAEAGETKQKAATSRAHAPRKPRSKAKTSSKPKTSATAPKKRGNSAAKESAAKEAEAKKSDTPAAKPKTSTDEKKGSTKASRSSTQESTPKGKTPDTRTKRSPRKSASNAKTAEPPARSPRKPGSVRPAEGSPSDWRRGPNGPSPSVESTDARERPEGGDRAASLLGAETARRLRVELATDPLFAQAARIAIERGAASPVLFLRRLGLGTPQARDLVTRLITLGVLDARSPSGAHPARVPVDLLDDLFS